MLFSKRANIRRPVEKKQAEELAQDAMSFMRMSKRSLAKAKSLRRGAAKLKDKDARLEQKKQALELVEEAKKYAQEAQEILVGHQAA